jgi:hypothetical protein
MVNNPPHLRAPLFGLVNSSLLLLLLLIEAASARESGTHWSVKPRSEVTANTYYLGYFYRSDTGLSKDNECCLESSEAVYGGRTCSEIAQKPDEYCGDVPASSVLGGCCACSSDGGYLIECPTSFSSSGTMIMIYVLLALMVAIVVGCWIHDGRMQGRLIKMTLSLGKAAPGIIPGSASKVAPAYAYDVTDRTPTPPHQGSPQRSPEFGYDTTADQGKPDKPMQIQRTPSGASLFNEGGDVLGAMPDFSAVTSEANYGTIAVPSRGHHQPGSHTYTGNDSSAISALTFSSGGDSGQMDEVTFCLKCNAKNVKGGLVLECTSCGELL